MSTHTSPAPPTLSPLETPTHATVRGQGRPGLTFPLAKGGHIKAHTTQTMMVVTAEVVVVEAVGVIRVKTKAVMLTMTMTIAMMMEIRKNIRNLIIQPIKNHYLKKDLGET